MQIIVLADEGGKEELMTKKAGAGIQFTFLKKFSAFEDHDNADAFLLLTEYLNLDQLKEFTDKPVFINAVTATLKDLHLPVNYSRIIGWPTFLKREIWEIAAGNEAIVKDIFEKLQWKYIAVADDPGLVSARIISMIINEAYYALGDNVSSKDEIDLAMKLGTNYPFGPFEWSKRIGIQKVYSLLEKLSETDSRYYVAPSMKNELLIT